MLKGFTEKGEFKNIKISEDGSILIEYSGNSSSKPMPVLVTNDDIETTLKAVVLTIGTSETILNIGKKVTQIDIANYSEDANVEITAGNLNAVIGNNLSATLKINKTLENIAMAATEANTKVQIIVRGEE